MIDLFLGIGVFVLLFIELWIALILTAFDTRLKDLEKKHKALVSRLNGINNRVNYGGMV